VHIIGQSLRVRVMIRRASVHILENLAKHSQEMLSAPRMFPRYIPPIRTLHAGTSPLDNRKVNWGSQWPLDDAALSQADNLSGVSALLAESTQRQCVHAATHAIDKRSSFPVRSFSSIAETSQRLCASTHGIYWRSTFAWRRLCSIAGKRQFGVRRQDETYGISDGCRYSGISTAIVGV
jgi:hypothetical protein